MEKGGREVERRGIREGNAREQREGKTKRETRERHRENERGKTKRENKRRRRWRGKQELERNREREKKETKGEEKERQRDKREREREDGIWEEDERNMHERNMKREWRKFEMRENFCRIGTVFAKFLSLRLFVLWEVLSFSPNRSVCKQDHFEKNSQNIIENFEPLWEFGGCLVENPKNSLKCWRTLVCCCLWRFLLGRGEGQRKWEKKRKATLPVIENQERLNWMWKGKQPKNETIQRLGECQAKENMLTEDSKKGKTCKEGKNDITKQQEHNVKSQWWENILITLRLEANFSVIWEGFKCGLSAFRCCHPPHTSLMFLTTSPQKPNICVDFLVSSVYSGLSVLVCLVFNLSSTHSVCKCILSLIFALFVLFLPFCVVPFFFSSLLSTSASSALHMRMNVCTPFHQFELLTFTLSIFSLPSSFLSASPIYQSPLCHFPFYLYPNVPLVLSKTLSHLQVSNLLSVSQVQPFFISSVFPSGSCLIFPCGCVCVCLIPPPPPPSFVLVVKSFGLHTLPFLVAILFSLAHVCLPTYPLQVVVILPLKRLLFLEGGGRTETNVLVGVWTVQLEIADYVLTPSNAPP